MSKGEAVLPRLDNKSWMTGDCHVRFSQAVGVRFLRGAQHLKITEANFLSPPMTYFIAVQLRPDSRLMSKVNT
jgi:hypothetical protein